MRTKHLSTATWKVLNQLSLFFSVFIAKSYINLHKLPVHQRSRRKSGIQSPGTQVPLLKLSISFPSLCLHIVVLVSLVLFLLLGMIYFCRKSYEKNHMKTSTFSSMRRDQRWLYRNEPTSSLNSVVTRLCCFGCLRGENHEVERFKIHFRILMKMNISCEVANFSVVWNNEQN